MNVQGRVTDWYHSLVPPLLGFGATGGVAWASGETWVTGFAVAGAAVTGIGGAIVGIYTQWKLSMLKVQLVEVEVQMARRKLSELDADKLHLEEMGIEINRISLKRADAAEKAND